MKQPLALFLLAIATATALPAHAQLLPQAAQGKQPLDRIVAVVDEGVILQSELNEAVRSVQQQYASNPGQLPPMDVLQRQVLDRLILMKLQVQRADDQGIRVSDADVDQAVNAVAQQNHMTPEQLRAAVEADGNSFAAFRRQLGDQLIAQRLHDSVVRDQVTITDSEINNMLASPSYKAGEVHLAHIQISLPAGASAADIKAAQEKATQAMDAIKGGMDFHAAAIRYSDAQDALEGGDLGWRRMDEIPPAFADAVGSMKAGDVSPAMRGPTGFHILKLIEQRQPSRQVVQEFHARQILIRPSELMTPEQAHQKAEDLYNRIVNKHEDFAKLAKENSKDDTTANNGGDMGWFMQNDWGSTIAQHLAELKDDQISQPFQSEAGWHILERLGTRQSDRTDELERNQARQAIGNRKAEQAYDDYLREMRSSAYVNILVPELRDPNAQQQGQKSS
ncbi:periplasmic chaperone for outer membrane proteins SurA [Dyella jiangningensis]|uniref:peptidylprolyl isomerase n=1 Tax=Dyella sp. AtDHG13 TaxID=1938897 RepID=UPI000885528D|nr:peptidylprolyl isomerase [Dyella sp. AtDHG13]PXV59845.1 periplasmic chaperone for outer membrane proteins SurA [Dyella sp. AtDHG13]SDJ20357.1 periplasmic chaperone for outer membrane proteins SurA [Dyella jiangningensis]